MTAAGGSLRFDAVLFDLYGTLVDSIEARGIMRGRYDSFTAQVAAALGAPVEGFLQAWRDTYLQRMTGTPATFEAYVTALCAALGVTPSEAQVAEALQLRLALFRARLTPRPDALAALGALRDMGLALGLISDCSWETALLWEETPLAPLFAAAAFSCTEGVRKPDARIYATVCARLGVDARRCLYIGDGGSDELAGAERAGMTALRIHVPYETPPDHADPWPGPAISALAQVPGWVTVAA